MNHTIGSRVADLMRLAGILLLTALTALAVVSCGGSDDTPGTPNPPVPPQPKADAPIAFSGDLSDGKSESHARTRAADLEDSHTTFYAWAYKNPTASTCETVMQNYTVNYISNSAGSTTSNSHGWEYVNQQPADNTKPEQSIKYWDYSATAYRFFGYAGSGVTASYSPVGDPTEVSLSFTASVSVENNLQTDPVTLPLTSTTPLYSKLWYKSPSAQTASQPVQLEFLQPYVKVRFLFKQSAPEDVVFELTEKSFKPTNNDKTIATAGTFTVTYPMKGATTEESWSVTGVTASLANGFTQDYYEADDDETDQDKLDAQKKWYVVLPAHADSQGSYTLCVSVSGDPRTVVVPAQYMEWRPGYEYTYIFKILDEGGVALDNVMVGFSKWTVVETDREIYNW